MTTAPEMNLNEELRFIAEAMWPCNARDALYRLALQARELESCMDEIVELSRQAERAKHRATLRVIEGGKA